MATDITNVELVPRVQPTKVVVRGRAGRGCRIQPLASHGHANFTRNGRGAETRLMLAVLNNVREVYHRLYAL